VGKGEEIEMREKVGESSRRTKKRSWEERKNKIRNIGGENKLVCVYMHLDVRLCSHVSNRDRKRERNRERETTNGTILR